MSWKDNALDELKKYLNYTDLEIDYEYFSGAYIENIGEDPENYVIFKTIDDAKESAIESTKELFEDTFDVKYMSKYIDINKCYIISDDNRYIIAEDICFYHTEYSIFTIIEELKLNLYETIENYSEFYIWEHDEIPEDRKIIKIDYRKCAELSVEKYGIINVLDSYYGKNEYRLPGGYVAYPCG